ncbi:MAG: MOSC domain-containing protein, partial [Methylococcus sp.]|nr:MOSC domain-containing protein [Methylococcus sp.]
MKNWVAPGTAPNTVSCQPEGEGHRIVSINTSKIKEVQFKGKTVPTGIFKQPVTDPVLIGFDGIGGDEQADLRCHGGPHKAVYLYGWPGYLHWASFLGRRLSPGTFGENLTVENLTEDDVRIGDLLICGDLMLQVSEPRISCFKLAMTLQEDPGFSRVFLADGRVGFYARVLREGRITVGDRLVHQPTPLPSPTVREFVQATYDANASLSELKFARNAVDLSPEWQALIAKRASALRLAKQGKAWSGYKRFVVAERQEECAGIASFYLAPADGAALPAYLPGQHVVVRTDVPNHGAVVRSYSLSSGQPISNRLRITIKRAEFTENDTPKHLSMSAYLHDSIRTGDELDVKAPAGRFFADETDDTPLVLLAGGVGITPLFAMFEGAALSGCATTLVYAARNEVERCFRDPIEQLSAAHPNLRAMFLSEEEFGPSLVHNTRKGRITLETLRELDLKRANIFVCGPPGFLDAAEALLKEAGVPDNRIHIEAFGARARGSAVISSVLPGEEHTVTFQKSGIQVKWSADQGTLLDLAEANGLRPPFGCRAGTCQACATRILSGSLDYLELVDPPSPEETFICCTV